MSVSALMCHVSIEVFQDVRAPLAMSTNSLAMYERAVVDRLLYSSEVILSTFASNGEYKATTENRLLLLLISVGIASVSYILASFGLVPDVFSLDHLYLSEPVVNDPNHGILYRGSSIKGVEHFHNIFYAQDTSGSNLFRLPVPFRPSHGSVIDATAPGAWCPQGVGAPPSPFASPITNVSENCLSLRIARSRKTRAGAKLPVVLSPPNTIPTPYYHLAAQLHRDFLFTCPILDFTSHYHSHAQDPTSIRIYEFNATRHGPGYQMMGVPFWGVAHLSDIPYILNTEEVPSGDNSAKQRELSERMSGSVAAFAWTGDPMRIKGKGVKGEWRGAFEGIEKVGEKAEDVGKANVKWIGERGGDEEEEAVKKAVEWERLEERCGFINSILEEIGS
ncbi:MAG: hypothetical protein LQ350_003757 [Teloschistes chrysophthalmus]|nr:MAG: hypothetical protein LQ350_003757 [Niorma chrysophthalma]